MTRDNLAGSLTDLHSHLVPGVDDGATTLEEALEGVGRMVALGIRTIVTTPHLDGSLTSDPEALAVRLSEVDHAFEALRSAAARLHPELVLRRGHEVRLDRPDPDLSDPRLRLGGSDTVLIEWPGFLIPPETPSVLRNLASQGVRPLIAHPERYRGYDPAFTLVRRWKEAGALLQVNFGSLAGRYGHVPRVEAFRLLELGLVDCLSSDFHGRPHLRLYVEEARAMFDELNGAVSWDILTGENPRRIAIGEDPMAVPPLEGGGLGLLDRIRSLFER